MSYFFLSYSRRDTSDANRLTDDLINIGQDVWLDTRDIPLGAEWQKRIASAVTQCDGMLLLCSPHSAASPYVKQEIEMALDAKKPVIPILLAGGFGDMPVDISGFNGHDFTNGYARGFAELTARLFPDGVPLSLQDMLLAGEDTFREAKAYWRQARSLDSGRAEAVLIPVARTAYCRAYLVGKGFDKLSHADEIQVALQFSGPHNDDFLNTVVDYMYANDKRLWCVLVQGHLNAEQTFYDLPDVQSEIWADGVEITWAAIERVWRRAKPLHFFSRAPVPLAMGIGFRKHLMSSVHVYNLKRSNEGASVPDAELYTRVYTYNPK